MEKRIKIIDLYCGCGGFGLGAELAGCRTVLAVDVDETLQSAYKLNFPQTKVLKADLSTTDASFWDEHTKNVSIDGVIGGPPCQGYSRMGLSDFSDPRRTLVGHFFRNINLIQPKFFIMENVEGLLDEKNRPELDIALKIVDEKYTVLEPVILDASMLGVPTKRKRVIVVGYMKDYFNHISTSDLTELPGSKTTVEEAISDLSSPIKQSKDKNDFGWGEYRQLERLSEYAKMMRLPPPEGLGSPLSVEMMMAGRVSGFFETLHSDAVKHRYKKTAQGQVDVVSRAKRLAWEGVCPTLRSGTGSDKGSHQAVRPIHPEQNRVITSREAARLQGFPDWFLFHPTKWHSFRMIGNSVSPIVSMRILDLIKSKFIDDSLKQAV